MFDLPAYLESSAQRIDVALDRLLPAESVEPRRLHQAMRYSLLAPGKRLRPILCLASAEAIGGKTEAVLTPAAAVEILHTYTLIHDDLPAMDNDTLRRGRATCHVAFDEATAILAGDALLTLSFAILSETSCATPYSAVDLVRELAQAAGSTGVIGGQMADIEGEGKPMSLEQLHFIHTHKTGDLIRAAVRLGAMTAGAASDHLAALTSYAEKIGLAFQIADDILNASSTSEELGKSAGTDGRVGKLTYVAAFGIDGARARAQALIEEAKSEVRQLPGHTEPLVALAHYITSRRK